MSRRIDRLEVANADLIAMLASMNDEVSRELAARMEQCRMVRLERRVTRTVADALRLGPRYRCKTVACWSCRTAHVTRTQARAARLFAMERNADCSMVTIRGEPCADLDDVAAQHDRMRDGLDNWRNAAVRVDRRFRRMLAFAVLEMQHDGSLWLPHWHVLMSHPAVDRQEIADLAQERWLGSRRVQVEPFHPDKGVQVNVQRCVGYATKCHHDLWGLYAQSRYWTWVRGRAALRSMIISMSAKLKQGVPRRSPQYVEIGPMPIAV